MSTPGKIPAVVHFLCEAPPSHAATVEEKGFSVCRCGEGTDTHGPTEGKRDLISRLYDLAATSGGVFVAEVPSLDKKLTAMLDFVQAVPMGSRPVDMASIWARGAEWDPTLFAAAPAEPCDTHAKGNGKINFPQTPARLFDEVLPYVVRPDLGRAQQGPSETA